ncbi:unnamed protein product, partial [Prorocentrum cordatum]
VREENLGGYLSVEDEMLLRASGDQKTAVADTAQPLEQDAMAPYAWHPHDAMEPLAFGAGPAYRRAANSEAREENLGGDLSVEDEMLLRSQQPRLGR